jgi:hypothetical protein
MKSVFMLAALPFMVTPAFAQYHQYYNPSYYSSPATAPVVVPPTVITTNPQEHNSSKKSCKESMIDLFLFSVRRTTGDCTP